MTVGPLRAKQRGSWCDWCRTRAVYRGKGFTRFACVDHLDALREVDRERPDNEADWYAGIRS